MLSQSEWHEAAALLPFLADPATEVTRAFVGQASLLRLPAAATVFEEGDLCSAFAILARGRVRVFKIGETGREITLYRFGRGESCILTASCILSDRHFPAIATVEEQAEAFVVPHTVFQGWIDEFSPWRNYVFQLLARRLATVMAVIDEVAFRRMDVRVAEFLTNVVSGWLAIVLGVLAAVFVLTSLIGFCPLYLPFGINTCGRPTGKGRA